MERDQFKKGEVYPIEGVSCLFGLYLESVRKGDLNFDAKEIVFSSVQKTLEASVEQRVVEEEREEPPTRADPVY